MTQDHRHADVAIIGAGTAGLTAQQVVAKHTDRYVVIDPGPLGTTCARNGCMPSKSLLQIADSFRQFRQMPGLKRNFSAEVDAPAVMAHVRRMRDDFVSGVLKGMEEWRDGHLLQKRARFLDRNTLDLEGQRLQADRILVATGAWPVVPDAWREFDTHLLTTERLFECETLPVSLLVVGLGPAGIELAQALQQLGSSVIGVNDNDAIGGLTDPRIREYATDRFRQSFDLRIASAEIRDANAEGVTAIVDGETLWRDRALITAGRRPAIEGLGLDKLDVQLNENGLPDIDPATLQVGDLPVFMAGDVNGLRPVLHEAADEGRIAAYNAICQSPKRFTRRTPLAIVFTTPAIAVVGRSFRSLSQQGSDFVVGSASFEKQGRAQMMNAEGGLLHLYADASTAAVLGAELAAPGGEHLAHLLSWAISGGMTIQDLLQMPFYHPALEEGLRGALREAARQLKSPIARSSYMRCIDTPVT